MEAGFPGAPIRPRPPPSASVPGDAPVPGPSRQRHRRARPPGSGLVLRTASASAALTVAVTAAPSAAAPSAAAELCRPPPPWVCPSVADLAPQAPAQASVWVPVPLSPPQARSEGRNRFQERGCGDPRPHGPRRVRGPGFPTSGGHSLRPGLRLLLFVPRPPWWVRGGVTGAPGDATSAPFRGCVGICVSPSGTRPLESLSVLRGYLGFSQQTAAQRSAESFIYSLIHSFSPSSAGRRA